MSPMACLILVFAFVLAAIFVLIVFGPQMAARKMKPLSDKRSVKVYFGGVAKRLADDSTEGGTNQ